MTSAKDMAAFKAVSENVMHSNVQITDRVYSRLEANEVKKTIQGLGRDSVEGIETEKGLIGLLEELLEKAKEREAGK